MLQLATLGGSLIALSCALSSAPPRAHAATTRTSRAPASASPTASNKPASSASALQSHELTAPGSAAAKAAEPEPVRHPFHEPLSLDSSARAPAMRLGNLSPAACRAELGKRKLPVKRIGAMDGVATPLRLTGKIANVQFVAAGGSSPYGVLDCRLALVLEPLAEILAEHGVVAVRVDNIYRPRARLPRATKKKKRPRSQHAHGLAMDVTSFDLADGRRLVVERDWHGEIGAAACGPEAQPSEPSEETVLLRNLVCAIVRRGIFHHVLTPNYDAAHRDHLHLDIQRDGYKVGVR